MKNIIYITLFAFLLASSCEVLDQQPETAVTPDVAFIDGKGARAALTGLYSRLQPEDYYGAYFQYTSDNYADVGLYLGFFTGFNEVDDKNIPSSNFNIEYVWLGIYEAINTANEIIDGVPTVEDENFPQEERDQILAEARTIRALAYLDLLTHWGEHWDLNSPNGLPLVTKSTGSNFANVEFIERSSVSQTYDLILSDLNSAVAVLADSDDRSQASLGLAQGLLARTYIFQKDYANAIAAATLVIENPNYELNPSYEDIFTSDLTSESVFELVYNSLDPSNLALYTIRRDEVRPDPDLIASFEEGDTRRNLIQEVDGFVGERFVKAEDFANDANPAYIMRIAELYLIRAEARFMSGDEAGALDDLNAVRTRAGLAPHADATDFIDKLLNEIRWEFFAEGQRFRALVRLNKAEEVLGIEPFRRVYPIPFREINIQGNLLSQNPGY